MMSATFTAGWVKLFDPNPKMGFIAAVRSYSEKVAGGGTEKELREWGAQVFNFKVDTVVTAFFLVAVAVIFVGCLREWVRLLAGSKVAELREEPYVALPEKVSA
mgnify:FL=1